MGFKPVPKQKNDVQGSQAAPVRHWWVNHKQAQAQELAGEYLWSPKKDQPGARNKSYDSMTRVLPGDVVFSFADAAIRAVGVALGRARETPNPVEFSSVGEQRGAVPGWQVPVRFIELERPLRPREHASELAAVLPQKQSPIRASGRRNEGVYLAAVPEQMASTLRRLLDGQVEDIEAKIAASVGTELRDDAMEEDIRQRTNLGPGERLSLLKARRGQGIFRENLERIEVACRVTGLADRRHLRASHIKPWCKSDDREKLDGFNGLLLSPHVEHLFDRGYLSFSDSGELLVSRALNPAVLESWGIVLPHKVGAFRPEQCRYLDYHRREVFEQHGGGRRSASTGGADEAAAPGTVDPVTVKPAGVKEVAFKPRLPP
jgi:putative restriction endonuclease